jgi:predicted TIM-barrel enzyme
MAAFASFTAAEQRAMAKTADGTWVEAHAGVTFGGTICVRIMRKMSASSPEAGAWVEVTDDATV